jgi:CheY-like chemotaxis protein
MVLATKPDSYSILITDDDQDCRETLRDIVEPEGFRTVLAESGEEAIEMVQRETVHLLVCDMYMPRLSGLETLQFIRQIRQEMPCILVSADVDDRLMQQALSAKAYSVLAKPVSKNVLLYIVMRALVKAYEEQAGSS